MRKNTSRVIAPLILITVAISSTSCRKLLEHLRDPNGQADCKSCNIKEIAVTHTDESGTFTELYRFTYNAAGDPLTIINDHPKTGDPNMALKYDTHGRLIEMIRPYSNGAYETYTKYNYNFRDQIVRDTQFIFGQYIDSVAIPDRNNQTTVSDYKYDGHERIIWRRDSVYIPGAPIGFASTTTYTYDANGNLVTGDSYDTHLNILRTNKVWMFLCRNYSIDNNFHASSYNAHELPLVFPSSYPNLYPMTAIDGVYKVKYACN